MQSKRADLLIVYTKSQPASASCLWRGLERASMLVGVPAQSQQHTRRCTASSCPRKLKNLPVPGTWYLLVENCCATVVVRTYFFSDFSKRATNPRSGRKEPALAWIRVRGRVRNRVKVGWTPSRDFVLKQIHQILAETQEPALKNYQV